MDEEDYKHVLSGSNDLAGCVLNGADFSGLPLSERNFANAKLGRANFKGANLEGSDFRGATISNTDFSNANLKRSLFNGGNVKTDFSGADLSEARLEGVYASVNFRGANLSDADLTGSRFNEGCIFDDAIVSERTLFDGVSVLRPYSRLPAFRYYTFARGTLRRISQDELETDHEVLRLEAIDALSNGLRALSEIPASPEILAGPAGMGHNNPPEEFQLTQPEIEAAQIAFSEARAALQEKEKDASKYSVAIESATRLALMSAKWSAGKVDVTITEFAKEFGKTLGGKSALVIVALHFTGVLERIVHALGRIIESLL